MNRLKELRKEKGYSQLNIEILTGIDQGNYSKIEQGVRYLTLEQCKRLAILYDTSMDYIAGLTDERTPYPKTSDYQNKNKYDIRDIT